VGWGRSIRLTRHFDGGTVLHGAGGAGGRGALLAGDIIQVVPDRKHVSLMDSYPNYIPLPASAVERVVNAVGPFEYDRVYGAFWDMVIDRDGKAAVKRSAGTLPGHAESGEERFTVEWREADGAVWYDILAFSRPRQLLARLGYPFARRLQRRFARDSAAAMRRPVGQGKSTAQVKSDFSPG
jgi:hypothetical protein